MATQADMAELMQRMADLKVRGTTTAAGRCMFSVIDFIQHARINTPTYRAATRRFRDIKAKMAEDKSPYAEYFRHDVYMIKLPRGDSTYRTPSMGLMGLQRLLIFLHDYVEPQFRRVFEGIITQFMAGNP